MDFSSLRVHQRPFVTKYSHLVVPSCFLLIFENVQCCSLLLVSKREKEDAQTRKFLSSSSSA